MTRTLYMLYGRIGFKSKEVALFVESYMISYYCFLLSGFSHGHRSQSFIIVWLILCEAEGVNRNRFSFFCFTPMAVLSSLYFHAGASFFASPCAQPYSHLPQHLSISFVCHVSCVSLCVYPGDTIGICKDYTALHLQKSKSRALFFSLSHRKRVKGTP